MLTLALTSGCATSSEPDAASTPSSATTAQTTTAATPTSTSPSATETPPTPPALGTCWIGAPNEVGASITDCDQSHNHETYFVKVFEPGPDRPKPSDLDDLSGSICAPELAAYVGSEDWRVTFLSWSAAPPKPSEVKAGALWLTCSVVQFPELTASGVATRVGSVRDALRTPESIDALRLCDPGTGVFTVCTNPHTFEAVRAVPLLDYFSAQPPQDEFDAVITPLCTDAVESYVGAARGDVVVSVAAPTAAHWAAGAPAALCYARTGVPIMGVLRGIGTGPLPMGG